MRRAKYAAIPQVRADFTKGSVARNGKGRMSSGFLLSCTGLLYNNFVTIETSYSQAREQLAALLDRVTNDLEVVIIKRRSGKRVALIDADEYESLMETVHLLRSPKNAERLLLALEQAQRGEGIRGHAAQLRREVLGGKAK